MRWLGLINAVLWLAAGVGWILESPILLWLGSAAALVMSFALYPAKLLIDLDANRRKNLR